MTIDTSVGVSNTTGYSYTGGDPNLTNIPGVGNDISSYNHMTGGGRKTGKKSGKKSGKKKTGKKKTVNKKNNPIRRKDSKKIQKMNRDKITSMKKHRSKLRNKYHAKKHKEKHIRRNIITMVESGKPVSNKDMSKLSSSMQNFIQNMDTSTKSKGTTPIRFSKFRVKTSSFNKARDELKEILKKLPYGQFKKPKKTKKKSGNSNTSSDGSIRFSDHRRSSKSGTNDRTKQKKKTKGQTR